MLEAMFEKFDSIVVLDVETTGIDYRVDEIIELAALRLDAVGSVDDELDVFIRLSDGRTLPPEIVRLTGITGQMLEQDGVTKSAACGEFLRFLDRPRTLIVAYNAQFDLCFLYRFLLKQGKAEALKGVKMLDALTVYKDRRAYPHKLSDAVAAYSLKTQNTHRAIDDTKATLELLFEMEKEQGDLEKYINLFGYNPRYGVSGQKISSVTYVEQGYNETRRLYEK